MQSQLQIDFSNMDHSDALESDIRARAKKLEQFFDQIISCHVTVAAPHKHQSKGITYNARIAMTVPGKELVVNRDNGSDPAHEDPYVAVRDAFDSARRLLQNHSRKIRDHSKSSIRTLEEIEADET